MAELATNLMDGHRPLKIEVLINSPGPHDQVRVRDPFLALQRLGVDCRIHERPFRFNSCIRPHSLVIWQRPMPESRQRQWEHLQWLRERGCLLLTEWDDHPRLFPQKVQWELARVQLAPLELCHGIHTSSSQLAALLTPVNPVALVLDNTVASIPPLNLSKHSTEGPLRVFIGNQNREQEHQQLIEPLREWLGEDPNVQLVIVGNRGLTRSLSADRLEIHPLLPYASYRQLLQNCHIALLPLGLNGANRCKTAIKWLECAAESVAVVAGPELYQRALGIESQGLVNQLDQITPKAREFARDKQKRLNEISKAHNWVSSQGQLKNQLIWRFNYYKKLWERREVVDQKLTKRLNKLGF